VISFSLAKVFARTVIGVSLLATTAFSQTVSIVSGDGQILKVSSPTPATNLPTVIVRDSSGKPVPKATLTWTVSPQGQGNVTFPTTVTDANGKATNSYLAPNLLQFSTTSFAQTKVTATLGSSSASFTITVENSVAGVDFLSAQIIHPSPSELPLTGISGQQASVPIQVRVFATGGSSINAGVPHVLLIVAQEAGSAATATCAEGSVFTDANGFAICHVVFGKLGSGALDVTPSGLGTITLSFQVSEGPPGLITILSGDLQTGNPGQALPIPLLAQVSDLGGNLISGVDVLFQAVVANTVTFTNVHSTSDSQGRVSAVATPAASDVGGAVQVRVISSDGKASATFTINIKLNVGQLTITAGDQQSAKMGTTFGNPLIVTVTDTGGNPLANAAVTFAVTSGSVTIGTANATTNAQGQASTTVTAGNTPGPATVTATVGGKSAQFSLTVLPPGPSCTPGSTFFNGASLQPKIAPGVMATIFCSGIATGIQGVVMPNLFGGPLPYQIAGVSVTFGATNIPAPVFDVVSWNGSESVTVEVPIDATLVGSDIPVTVTASDGSTTVNADILQAAPGIFESIGTDNKRRAVVLRPDGSVATPGNPLLLGEIGRAFVTGLIPPPGLGTNMLSPIDSDIAITTPVIVGVDNAGVQVPSVKYARNLVGVWEVEFVVPSSSTPGPRDAAFAVAVPVSGKLVFGQSSLIPVK
jgi:uncharacterized protein (TIGR03437 family)